MKTVILVFFVMALPAAVFAQGSVIAPGGVSEGLVAWLKQEGRVENDLVRVWENSAMPALSPQQNETAQSPIIKQNALSLSNGNAVTRFDGIDDVLVFPEDAEMFFGDEFELFIVRRGGNNNGYLIANPSSDEESFAIRSDGLIEFGAEHIQLPINDHTMPALIRVRGSEDTAMGQVNGHGVISLALDDWGADVGALLLGARNNMPAEFFAGWIAELIIYERALSADEVERVHSYLATKYGLTLGHGYFASDGAQIWSQNGHPDSAFNVAGIGRDDGSGLLQTTSASMNAESIVEMQSDAGIGDLAFVFWGSSEDALIEYEALINGANVKLLRRHWHIHTRKSAGSVNVSMDLSDADISGIQLSDFWLVLDDDEELGNGVRSVYRASDLDNERVLFNQVTFEDDDTMYLVTDNPDNSELNVSNEEGGSQYTVPTVHVYPNPLTDAATIAYELPWSGLVKIHLIDVLGREVALLKEGWQPAGKHYVHLNGHRVAPGLYMLSLQTSASDHVQPIIILK